MPSRPEVGEEVVHEVEVTSEMTARLFDREIHPLYATAWLVRHAEEAGRLIIERHLGPGEDATGYHIEVTHERPARVGDRLTIRARVTEASERSCTVAFEATGPAGLVGRGMFVQRYVSRRDEGEAEG